MSHIRWEIKKFYVVHTYINLDEMLVATIEVEKVLGKIGETFYEPLKDEKEEEMNEGDTSTE